MTQPSLYHISPLSVDVLRRSADDTRHEIVERTCLLAIASTGAKGPVVTDGLAALRSGRTVDADLRGRVDVLTEELDSQGFGLGELVDEGRCDITDYQRVFRRARAVAALGHALDGSLEAAFLALYEAYHAIDDENAFMRTVLRDHVAVRD